MVGAVILAAGAATRMGKTKQLLTYRGQTLIQHAVSEASVFSPVVVVLGANAEQIQAHLKSETCHIALNPNWQTGMGSSLKVGLHALLALAPEIEAVAALLADQPRITARHLTALLNTFQEGNWPIVAAEYNGAAGVPAIFGKQLFPKLLNMPAEAGARHILRDAGTSVFRFPLPEAAIDVDTPEDYAALS